MLSTVKPMLTITITTPMLRIFAAPATFDDKMYRAIKPMFK